jgi:hypothetical protein
MLKKKYAYVLAVRLHFGSAGSNSIADQLARWGETFRLLACVLFNIGGSLIDGGVNFRPPG